MNKITLFLLIVLISSCSSNNSLRFGAIADCQFCNKPNRGVRHYSDSTQKLKTALHHFQQLKPEWIVHLGDFIDEGYESFEPLLQICKAIDIPIKHVLGNHDFSVADKFKEQVPSLLGMPSRYYSWNEKGWRFIAVDGNDLSLYAYPKDSTNHKQSQAYYKGLNPRPPNWNGGVGTAQIDWLHKELKQAESNGEKVILMCHFPIYPKDIHNLWNDQEMLKLIDQYSCVKAWLNGHNHKGNYGERNGVHYITFKGMVDTKSNSYTLIEIDEEKMRISGFGREKNRELIIKK